MAKKPTKPAPKKRRSKPEWVTRFLELVAKTGIISVPAKLAGIHRDTVYTRRDADPEFAKTLSAALDHACDLLEAEARRRAERGVVRKKFTKNGAPVIDPNTKKQYCERDYSDTL